MKRLTVIALLASAIAFTGCKKKDEGNKPATTENKPAAGTAAGTAAPAAGTAAPAAGTAAPAAGTAAPADPAAGTAAPAGDTAGAPAAMPSDAEFEAMMNKALGMFDGMAKAVDADLGLILVHSGAARNKKLVDAIKAIRPELVDCPAIKTWELPQFVSREIRQLGGSADPESPQLLVEAVGHDLRALAAAVSQLLADSEHGAITAAQVRRYFGGRAEVTSFAVADATLSGRTGVAMEQLRWALSTGVAPVLVTSAFASGVRGLGKLIGAPSGMREGDLAREVGVPPWKLKSMRSQARGWDQRGLARALQAVATADAAVKGAADDAEFALEQLVLAVANSRRS